MPAGSRHYRIAPVRSATSISSGKDCILLFPGKRVVWDRYANPVFGRFRFDRVEFDGFIAFLDSTVERAAGLFLVFRLRTDRIHMDHFGIAFLIPGLHGVQGFIKEVFPLK